MKTIIIKFIYFVKSFHYFLLRHGSKIMKRINVRRYYLPNLKMLNLHNEGSCFQLSRNQIKEIKQYWHNFSYDFDITFHKYYCGVTNHFDVRFIPDDLYMGVIDPYLNNRNVHDGVFDKNYFDLWFKEMDRPITYVRIINGVLLDRNYRIITLEEAIEVLVREKEYLVKPSVATYGETVRKLMFN